MESASELEGLGVGIFLGVMGIVIWKFISHQIAAFLCMIEKVWQQNFSSSLFFCTDVESVGVQSLNKQLALSCLMQIGITVQVIVIK